MPEETHKNTEIKNYLLGNLMPEETKQEIEKNLLLDDSYFEEFLIAESELVQDYVDELLSDDERANFEQNYLVSESRIEKVDFARAFRSYVDEQVDTEILEIKKRNGEKGFVYFFKNFFSSPLPAALAALVIVVISGLIIWNFVYTSSPDSRALASLNKAYEKERPLEARILGLNYAPTNNLRGSEKNKVDTTELDLARSLALKGAKDNPKAAESLHSLGQVYLTEKNFDKAIEQLEKARNLAPQNAEILSDLGAGYFEKGKFLSDGKDSKFEFSAKALETMESALQLKPNLPEARFNKALILQELNATAEARKAWREYLELDSTSKWADEARQNLEALGNGETQSKSKQQVLEDFLTAYQNKDDDLAWRVSSRNREMIKGKLIPQQLAFSFLNASDGSAEKKKSLQALKYAGELENKNRKDSYFLEIADFYAGSSVQQQVLLKAGQQSVIEGFDLCLNGKYKESYEAFKNAQKLFDKAGDVWEAGLAEYWAAMNQYYLRKLPEHRKVLENLAEFCQKKNYKWFAAEIYIWLGVNAEESTQYSKAIEYHKKAVDLCAEISEIYNQEKPLAILADEYAGLNQYKRSLDSLQKGLALSAEYPETSLRQKRRTLNTAAKILYQLNYFTAAIAFETEALAIVDETDDITFKSNASMKMGMIYEQQQKYKQASELLNQSKEFAESMDDKGHRDKYLSSVYVQLGNLKRHSGNCGGALEDYGKAIESSAMNKPNEYTARKGRLLCFFAQNDGESLEQEIPVVLDLFEKNRRQITEEGNRNTFFDNEQGIYDLAINYEFGKGDYEQAYDYSETSRSRSLLDLMKNGGKVSDKELEIKLPRIAEPLKLSEIRPSIPEDVQIVQYAVLNDKVLIWLITKNDFSVFSFPVTAKALNEKVSFYLENLTDRNTGSFETQAKLSRELYEILISPVKGKLDSNKEIAFVPDKFLFRLPFSALISPETGKYLVEDLTSFYSPSANVFLLSSAKAGKDSLNKKENILAVGNPAFDRNSYPDLPELPSAERETRKIAGLYPQSTNLIGRDATKEALKIKFPQADIVHFAGHYVVNENSPMRSFLLLAGNGDEAALSNYELMKENPSPRTKLIILSACQTGVERYYNGEGMIGASRIFLGMGIPLVVASQWQVDSDATEILMTKFHQYRKQDNLSSAAALRRAQLDMLGDRNKDFQQPFYWAAFAPIGGYTQF